MTASSPMLALEPGTRTVPGPGVNTGPGSHSHPFFTADTAFARAGQDYFTWLDHIWSAAGCRHPVRLHGDLRVIDTRTGELLRSYSTEAMPDRVIYKACGNRRSAACPSCAETYRRDAYHVIRSGLIGGKGVPETVSAHPAVFATFTAPLVRSSAHPACPPPHLHRPGRVHLSARSLPRSPRRRHLRARPVPHLLHSP